MFSASLISSSTKSTRIVFLYKIYLRASTIALRQPEADAKGFEIPRRHIGVSPGKIGERLNYLNSSSGNGFCPRVRGISIEQEASLFWFTFQPAFSVPRSKHPRPSDGCSPCKSPRCASSRCGLHPRTSCGPLPKILSSREAVGRDGTPARQAYTASCRFSYLANFCSNYVANSCVSTPFCHPAGIA